MHAFRVNLNNLKAAALLKFIAFAVVIVYLCSPHRFASHYEYIMPKDIYESLVQAVAINISLQDLPNCDYQQIISNSQYTYLPYYKERIIQEQNQILNGGEYYPTACKALFSTAVIVPYRQREQQLHAFLIYMHNYLRQQNLHYRIFLVEQYDQKPFNRAKLFNVGASIANEYGFPCLILHDVDLLPLNSGQMYACSQRPRHMSAALDIWRFHLPYRGLFGGVVAITTAQYQSINGMSNMYDGWGGEDDDLYERLSYHGLEICRYAPAYSEYTMLKHKREHPNENRVQLLRAATYRFYTDGLNSLVYKEKERRLHSLFTHILVET